MAEEPRLICEAHALPNGSKGLRFNMDWGTKTVPGFVIRYRGTAHAYLNCCPHQGTELDWVEGEFFDESGLYLICATHGATFMPASGYCCAGPCKGQSLIRIKVEERNGKIFWVV